MGRIGRNASCPCDSGLKYKQCCLGKVDWGSLQNAPLSDQTRYLSLRGKNLLFLDIIMQALQLDSPTSAPNFAQIKKAFTPKVVRSIHEAIPLIWPDFDDYRRSLAQQQQSVTALYTGDYQPERVFSALTRHSLYSDRILLVDPFMHPFLIADRYNPLIHPEQHVVNTVKWAFLWICLYDWIDAGVVNLVRTPADFIAGLYKDVVVNERERVKANPELNGVLNEYADETVKDDKILGRGLAEYLWLSWPDDQLREMYRSTPGTQPSETEEQFMNVISQRRADHPYFVDPLPSQGTQLIQETTGASYGMAKSICTLSHSHLVTNLRFRWKQIELDHKEANIDPRGWTPFAKALQNSDLKVLGNIPLKAAFSLRRENRLEGMRSFFNKMWRACHGSDVFSESNAADLAAELNDKIREADHEWKKIDIQLLKWFGSTGGALVMAGAAGFLPGAAAAGAAAIAGAVHLAQAYMERKSFMNRYPAAFFLSLRQ
jgi:hypothetical protein